MRKNSAKFGEKRSSGANFLDSIGVIGTKFNKKVEGKSPGPIAFSQKAQTETSTAELIFIKKINIAMRSASSRYLGKMPSKPSYPATVFRGRKAPAPSAGLLPQRVGRCKVDDGYKTGSQA